MENIISIFLFISIFLITTGVLYHFLLNNKVLQKRLNYYMDIENRYKRSSNNKDKAQYLSLKDFGRNLYEVIKEILVKGLPSNNQKKIKQMLESAGSDIKPEDYVLLRIASSLIMGGVFYLMFRNLILILPGFIIGIYIPKMWMKNRIKKRVEKFNDGLADMITIIIGSLKSGYSLAQALKTVADESETPVKDEVRTVLNELNYGITMEEALNNLLKRMPSMDLELMIHATLIQRQIGGNLSTILEIIVNTIRERKKLERHVKTLTAQGRLSGKILSGLPIFIAAVMYIFNRQGIVDFISNRYGQIAIAVGCVSCVMGFLIINKLTKIEV